MNNVLESWQSGNATDSKSVEPAYTGARVRISYSPLIKCWNIGIKQSFTTAFLFLNLYSSRNQFYGTSSKNLGE